MNLKEFSKYLEKLENTPKRLEITDILADLIKKLDEKEIDLGLYLSLGTLKAPFENEKFNLAEKMMVRVLAQATGTDQTKVQKIYSQKGDLGDVCLDLIKNTRGSSIDIAQTHQKLLEIAQLQGSGSQEAKVTKLADLLKNLDPLSAKYVTRIVLGNTRLGFTELTIIDALTQNLESDKTQKEKRKQIAQKIENIFNIHPDIGLIAKKINQKGLVGLKDIKIEIGIPILPQRCQRLASLDEIIKKMGTAWAEYKFDGTRVQLHLDRNKKLSATELEQQSLFGEYSEPKRMSPTTEGDNSFAGTEVAKVAKTGQAQKSAVKRMFIKTFTRNLEENSYQYPDIVQAAESQLDATQAILDGEAIGYNRQTGEFLPFQQIMQRKRKYDITAMAQEIPLKYFVFDILYLDGQDLTKKTLRERRETLKKVIKKNDVILIDDHLETSKVEALQKYFDLAHEKGLEGLIIKNPETPYQAGARSFAWIKLKVADAKLLDDTVDVVVLGYYFGRGARAHFGIGGFLVGIYDKHEDAIKTITKVGTGLSDADWVYLKSLVDATKVLEKPQNVILNKIYDPDVWADPKIIVELGADEITKSATHSAGYALRFPRLINFRDDKGLKDLTTLKEIVDLYKLQKRGYYS